MTAADASVGANARDAATPAAKHTVLVKLEMSLGWFTACDFIALSFNVGYRKAVVVVSAQWIVGMVAMLQPEFYQEGKSTIGGHPSHSYAIALRVIPDLANLGYAPITFGDSDMRWIKNRQSNH